MDHTRSISTVGLGAILALAALACGDDAAAPTDAGMGVDARTDAGRRDAGRRDSGPTDPCAADVADAFDSVGCNGPILGPEVDDGELGGRCTPGGEDDPAGSCADRDALCDAGETGTVGICLLFCTPQPTYVSTSDCPPGSRCFTFDPDFALCYPDCEDGGDCTTGVCDLEGGCVPDDSPPMLDGGMDDGGSADGGTADGGTADGGGADGGATDASGADAAAADAGP